MPSYSTDRRGALRILGAIGASCMTPIAGDELYGRSMDEPPTHQHTAGPEAPLPVKPMFFTGPDFETISRIADLIIPPTASAGAIAAGVPSYIDMIVTRNGVQQSLMNDGLRWLDEQAKTAGKTRFVDLSEASQLAFLQPLCEAADEGHPAGRLAQFFALVKGLTTDGYYTSRAGLMEELGYKGNTIRSEFPECVHEH